MPKVYNRHHPGVPKDAVYIGRGTLFGNPARLAVDGSRAQVLAFFREHLAKNPELQAAVKAQLRGRDLVCSCKPLDCHGDILLALANPDDQVPQATEKGKNAEYGAPGSNDGKNAQKNLFL